MTDGVFSLLEDNWTTHNRTNTPAFDTITDMVSVKVDPQNINAAYIGTWQTGIIKFVDNEISTIWGCHKPRYGLCYCNEDKRRINGSHRISDE